MKNYNIAVIAGDGIGPEVIAEAKKVLCAAAETDGRFSFSFTDYPWGCEYYLKTGEMMPKDALKTLMGVRRDPSGRGRLPGSAGPHLPPGPAA